MGEPPVWNFKEFHPGATGSLGIEHLGNEHSRSPGEKLNLILRNFSGYPDLIRQVIRSECFCGMDFVTEWQPLVTSRLKVVTK